METLLKKRTRERFGIQAGDATGFESIVKGGSERSFRRAEIPGLGSVIVMQYSAEKEENRYYADIAAFLREIGVRAPEILGHDTESGIVWMQDLGMDDLHAHRLDAWPERRAQYQNTLEMIRKLHDRALPAMEKRPLKLMPGFDAKLYAWEHNYFLERFVHDFCNLELSAGERTNLDFELGALAGELCRAEPSLVHRDFQSQNVVWRGNEAWLIDFQGLRVGTRHYDLGSLLYDPYVSFTEEQRQELLDYYHVLGETRGVEADFRNLFFKASAQRLMQALGAYGFLGLVKEKKEFLEHIPSGLCHLRLAAVNAGTLGSLEALVDRCISCLESRNGK